MDKNHGFFFIVYLRSQILLMERILPEEAVREIISWFLLILQPYSCQWVSFIPDICHSPV